jgi:hypothetical protein
MLYPAQVERFTADIAGAVYRRHASLQQLLREKDLDAPQPAARH